MKALSIKQPWAWLICAGYKDILNRNWRIGRKSQHGPYSSYHQANFSVELPCRIYVHTSKTIDTAAGEFISERLTRLPSIELANVILNGITLGAIIGEVDIIGCVAKSESIWFTGKYGFVLANPVLYKVPIPCRGKLGFFEPDIDLLKGMNE